MFTVVQSNTRKIKLNYSNSLGYFLIRFSNSYNNDVVYGVFANFGTTAKPVIQIKETGNVAPNPLAGEVNLNLLGNWKADIYKQSSSSNLNVANATFITSTYAFVQADYTATSYSSEIVMFAVVQNAIRKVKLSVPNTLGYFLIKFVNPFNNDIVYSIFQNKGSTLKPIIEIKDTGDDTPNPLLGEVRLNVIGNWSASIYKQASSSNLNPANATFINDTTVFVQGDAKCVIPPRNADVIKNCGDVKDCFGISASGDANKFLNEQGDFIEVNVDDINGLIQAGTNIVITGNGTTASPFIINAVGSGTVTSVQLTAGTGISLSGTNPITTSGNITVTNNAPDQTVVLNAGTGISVSGTYPNFTVTNASPSSGGTVTSVGLTMPSAFNVANSPITGAGTLAVTGAGTASQYVRGDGVLATLPTGGGGGASVSYYLNGSVNQGTFGGSTYYEINKTAVIGVGTNFSTGTNGLIAQFITDANDPAQLLIPSGNWNFELYFSASSSGGNPSFYVELHKYNGTTFSLIASSQSSAEGITNGTSKDIYITPLAVPETVLLATDRLAIRVYVTTSGRTLTLHTEDNNLCQIITTFSTGLTALNGLTKQVQYFAVGTNGTDFAISSATDTHTFNLPTASAIHRGALSSADWSTFNGKQDALGYTAENTANKSSSYTASSTTTYANTKALVDGLATKENTIGYTTENVANKATTMTGNTASNTLYLTAKAVYDWAIGLFIQKNAPITGATKTKITYDANGLVTAGADLAATDLPTGIDAAKIANGLVSNTEFQYLDGVSSAIQTQINGKEATITTLPISKGGTNSGTALNNNRVIQSSGGAIVEASAITASRALKSDANGIPTHFDTATEPSLTELSYVKGVTSSIQTQINNKVTNYYLPFFVGFNSTSPQDGLLYYFSQLQGAALSQTAANMPIKFFLAGTLESFIFILAQGVNGSNETVTVALRNITTSTDTTLGTFTSDFGANARTIISFTSLSIALNTTDTYTIKITCPTWATNPTNWLLSGNLNIKI